MNQLTLGELIKAIEALPDKDKSIQFDFCWAEPVDFCSYRGYYEDLAIVVEFFGYGHGTQKAKKAIDFLSELKATVGQTFTGWKGGEYKMTESTTLWVTTHWGNSTGTGITGVSDNGYNIIINTANFD